MDEWRSWEYRLPSVGGWVGGRAGGEIGAEIESSLDNLSESASVIRCDTYYRIVDMTSGAILAKGSQAASASPFLGPWCFGIKKHRVLM